MDGVLLIDKPAGKTSHDIVAAIRREHPPRTKVGHAGTLDPFATGLLLVTVGQATRAQRFFTGLPKAYETTARLGATSTTGDSEGEIAQTGRVPSLDGLPTGRVRQRPPAHSAVHIEGVRAYERARRGETVVTAEREVEVTRFDLLERDGDTARFAIECSSGTYVRSLIADLADAYCVQLRRTAIGPFSVEDADPARLMGLAEALGAVMAVVELDEDAARRAGHGQRLDGDATGTVLLVDPAGEPVAIAEGRDGALKPSVGFRAS